MISTCVYPFLHLLQPSLPSVLIVLATYMTVSTFHITPMSSLSVCAARSVRLWPEPWNHSTPMSSGSSRELQILTSNIWLKVSAKTHCKSSSPWVISWRERSLASSGPTARWGKHTAWRWGSSSFLAQTHPAGCLTPAHGQAPINTPDWAAVRGVVSGGSPQGRFHSMGDLKSSSDGRYKQTHFCREANKEMSGNSETWWCQNRPNSRYQKSFQVIDDVKRKGSWPQSCILQNKTQPTDGQMFPSAGQTENSWILNKIYGGGRSLL